MLSDAKSYIFQVLLILTIHFSLLQKQVFIFKMGLGISFCFQNVFFFFRNVLSFLKCERFGECCSSFFQKRDHPFKTLAYSRRVGVKICRQIVVKKC